MANKKISELQSRTPALSDLMLVGDPSSGYSYKCTVTALATIIETDIADGYVTIGTTQTISGAKTFSNNLTLTSVANATTTQSKFLTLNGSNVVNYRTGAEVLADIGGASSASISGTTNYVAKFTSSSAIGNSTIQDSGSLVTIGSNTTINTNAPELTLNQGTSSVSIINFKENNSPVNRITSSGATLYFTTNNSATTSLILSSAGTAVFGTIPNATIDTDKFLVSDSGVLKYRTGAELLSDIGGQGTISLAAIGSTPNANGATLSSNTLTLQPASASFGGVLTTGFQEIAGWKRFTGNPIQFDNHLEIKNLNSWGVSWGYTSFASKDTPVFGFLRGHSSTGSVTYNAWFTYGTTGDRNYTLPSSDGTLALTSQVPTVSGTTNYIPKFTSSSAIGNSAITDNGSITTSLQDFYVSKGNAIMSITSTNTGGFSVLRLQSSGISDLWFGRESSTSSIFGLTPSSSVIYSEGAHPFITFVNGSERMRLDASGNLGINTSSPSYKLDVSGSGRFTGNLGINGVGPTYPLYVRTGTNQRFRIVDGGSGYTQLASLDDAESAYTPIMIGNSWVNINASGNLGLGVSPSAWLSSLNALQIGAAHLFGQTTGTGTVSFGNNVYLNSTPAYIYQYNGKATRYSQYDGQHEWYTAPSGTAGNAISFTQAMTLDASGNLGIGQTNIVATDRTSITVTPTSPISGSPANSSSLSIRGGTTTVGNGPLLTLINVSGAKETVWKLSAVTTSGNNGDLVFNGYAGGSDFPERMRITSGGYLLLGTTTSAYGQAGRGTFEMNGTTDNILVQKINNSLANYIYSDATKTEFYSTNFLQLSVNGSERMRITSGGNVGIGNTAPLNGVSGGGLQITNSTAAYVRVNATGFTGLDLIQGTDGTGYLFQRDNNDIRFGTNNSERMRITSGGNVLIGNTGGTHRLSVVVPSGADREILIAGVDGASNGFRVAWNHANSQTHVSIANIPTSSSGLPTGTIWNDGGTLKIV